MKDKAILFLFALSLVAHCVAHEYSSTSPPNAHTIPLDQKNYGGRRSCEIYAASYQAPSNSNIHFRIAAGQATTRRHMYYCEPDLSRCSARELAEYFVRKGYTEAQVLAMDRLYMSDEFVKLVKQLNGYEYAVTSMYIALQNEDWWGRFRGFFARPTGFRERIQHLYRELLGRKQVERAMQEKCRREAEEQRKQAQAAERAYQDLSAVTLAEVEQLALVAQMDSCVGQRAQALAQTQANPARTQRSITLDQKVIMCAQAYGLGKADLLHGSRNAYEHQLHGEFVDQLTQLSELCEDYAHDVGSNFLLDTLGQSIGLGIQSNQRREPLMATYLADFGWEVLEVAKGVGEGLLLWGENTVDMARHPVQTVQNMVYGVGMLVWAAAKVVHVPVKLSAMCIEGKYELARLQAEEMYEQSQQLIEACQTQLAQTSNRELAKHATAICADFFLTGQVLGLVKKTCIRAAPVLIGAVEFLKEEREVEYVVATAEGPLVQLSEKAKQVGGAGEAAKQALHDGAGEVTQRVVSSAKRAKKTGLVGKVVSETAINQALSRVSLDKNRIHHILAPKTGKHAWNLVCKDALDWQEVKKIIKYVLLEGETMELNHGVLKRSARVGEKIVEVMYRYEDTGAFSIVNAWVKTI